MSRTSTYILAAVATLLIIALIIVVVLALQDNISSQAEPSPTLVATLPQEQAQATEVVETEPARLPPPAVDIPPTFTPQSTSTATGTPLPTATSEPTDIPLPTNTIPASTPTRKPLPPPTLPPTAAPPTNTPGPTNTPVADTKGVIATSFEVDYTRSQFGVNQPIWFKFGVMSTTGQPVDYGSLGVMPSKYGVDQFAWYQHSYGGGTTAWDRIPPEGFNHEDNIRIQENGSFAIRLVICFDAHNACRNGQGTFVSLSGDIPVDIN